MIEAEHTLNLMREDLATCRRLLLLSDLSKIWKSVFRERGRGLVQAIATLEAAVPKDDNHERDKHNP